LNQTYFAGSSAPAVPRSDETSPDTNPSQRVAGDVNGDHVFDSSDLVRLFQIGEYEDDLPDNSTWYEGDWNGDGDFTTADFVYAMAVSTYQQQRRRAASGEVSAAEASHTDDALAAWHVEGEPRSIVR
jgi:hypothetical protein